MGEDPEDRRRAERVPVNAEFAGLPKTTFVSNLSEHGVFVHTDVRWDVGSMLDLRFTILLDDPFVLAARGKVVRHQSDPPGMGIEFADLDPEMILRINDVVTRKRPRDSGPPIEPARQEVSETAETVAIARAGVIEAKDFRARPVDDSTETADTLRRLKPVDVVFLDEDGEDDQGGDEGGAGT